MFVVRPIDWTDPRFSKWKLPEELNDAQKDAFLADDDDEVTTWFSFNQQCMEILTFSTLFTLFTFLTFLTFFTLESHSKHNFCLLCR